MQTAQASGEIVVGGEYNAMGEPVEVTNERGDEVCLHHPERTAPDGSAYTAWRPRETVEAIAGREGWTRVDTPADDADDGGEYSGEFVDTPQCPICSRFMRTWYEDHTGMPIATCQRDGCEGVLGAYKLVARGYYESADC